MRYQETTGQLRAFMRRHYTNFNSRETLAAAEGYVAHLDAGGKMMVTLSGAMSTAGIGRVLARMIRDDKVHAITCTGANLEEDLFLLLAGNEYEWCRDWRALRAEDEQALYDRGMNRVTDTCIPETVMRHVEHRLKDIWTRTLTTDERLFPHEFLWEVLGQDDLPQHYQMPPEDSWMIAAKEKQIPVYTPGWEDSTLGNIFTAWAMQQDEYNYRCLRTGTEALAHLARWYRGQTADVVVGSRGSGKAGCLEPPARVPTTDHRLLTPAPGFFQIGGGIAGDFPICAVPMMIQDLKWADTPYWGYFCQVCDAPTSYGGYSGAVPNEKITWGKLTPETPRFMVQSDATIVVPLVFGYVLGD
jgi:deoxyhypusine synthase